MKTDPIPVVRQHRPVTVKNFTSAEPGKITPVMAFGLLQGDSASGRLPVAVEMNETFEVLFNDARIRATLWFVPKLVLDRFKGNKTYLERSAAGEPITDDAGAPVIPYIQTMAHPAPGTHPIFKSLGLSAKQGVLVSDEYQEAYNQIVKFMYRQRSKSLTPPLLTSTALAVAMWEPSPLSEIVPDFDVEMITGSAPLSVVGTKLPVTVDNTAAYPMGGVAKTAGANQQLVIGSDGGIQANKIYAQLSKDGITVALANIDQARKLVDMAKLREGFEGWEDPYIIDRLMSGLPVDDLEWQHPMLLDQKTTTIEQLKRMATDGASLEDGVANGMATFSLGCNVPANPFGGTVMMLVECIPEQLYERQADPYFTTTNLADLPRYDRDAMNPMPVVEVLNKQVDTDHSNPTGRFGYARRNWNWAANPARIGGVYFAPTSGGGNAEARKAIWPTDVANPALNTEFYLATTLGKQVFLDQTNPPFRIGIGGTVDVVGLTIIGAVHESEANYDAVRAEYPPLAVPAGQ